MVTNQAGTGSSKKNAVVSSRGNGNTCKCMYPTHRLASHPGKDVPCGNSIPAGETYCQFCKRFHKNRQ